MAVTAFKNLWESSYTKMPGHWLLASMGKRVLRPGGLELSHWMIDQLNIGTDDDVVELAPGLGRTAQLTLERKPHSYTGVEKSQQAASQARKVVNGPNRSIQIGDAEATGLSDACATVAYGEAFLTMQSPQVKAKILREIARILKPGGMYGMHELSLISEDAEVISQVHYDLSESIRVNAKPLSINEWKKLLENSGFEVIQVNTRPMALLQPRRLLKDEGAGGVVRLLFNLLTHPTALARVIQMRRQFTKHASVLLAVGIVARRK